MLQETSYQIGYHISCQVPILKAIFQRRLLAMLTASGLYLGFMKTYKNIAVYHKKQYQKLQENVPYK